MNVAIVLCLVGLAAAAPSARDDGATPETMDWSIRNRIPMSDLDGQTCLPGDRGQTDVIRLTVEEGALGDCFSQDYVGVKLRLNEAINKFKAVRLHARTDASYFKSIVEERLPIFDPYQPTVALFRVVDLVNYDVCLWKNVNEAIGNSDRNVYLLNDAREEMTAGNVYDFYWIEDENC